MCPSNSLEFLEFREASAERASGVGGRADCLRGVGGSAGCIGREGEHLLCGAGQLHSAAS